MVVLVGPLADRKMLRVLGLTGHPTQIAGRLTGGARAGTGGDWPVLKPGAGTITGVEVQPTARLDRYARIMGLRTEDVDGRSIMGIGEDSTVSDHGVNADLIAAVAAHVLESDQPDEDIARRIGPIAGWIASRLRGASAAKPLAARQVESLSCAEPYSDYFAVEAHRLRHTTFAGGWSADLRRAVFVSGDACVVLPWDPVRDLVLLIEQFRPGPFARHDPNPWLIETIAGRIDAGESPEDAARREAIEEAGLTLHELIQAPSAYSSPGMVAEYLYNFVAITELDPATGTVGGLETEDEDIRSFTVPREELTRMAMAGEIGNGPLLTLALWLECSHAELRQQFGTQPR
ncbi:MAG: NUDIX hydrolase [Paracoccus denitrificans]|nr:MAG: NUDIX hydrolase [Paracoccus denitrificans]PZO84135.1 MAG: NUDIX hydrolase [Paracoccus denitrificans]